MARSGGSAFASSARPDAKVPREDASVSLASASATRFVARSGGSAFANATRPSATDWCLASAAI